MTPQQFAELRTIFDEAIYLPAEERAQFVRSRSADSEVLQKLEAMLAHADAGAALEVPALGRGFHVGSADEIERRLLEAFEAEGRYRIEAKIGQGGFGTVYRATQLQPVTRTVALKVVKLGMDTHRVVARFEAERQTLAQMDHPAIAKVFDAGVMSSGRPYFVMEFVQGVPITEYCRDKRLDIAERLRLFVAVCHAVQHAHQKGVIHRDLKPSNVLVGEADGRPLPKVIDFGIARAIDATGADDSGAVTLTDQGQPIGTPAYMSPEQAAGQRDIDTRTDIYSLGALLYEMLTGAPPLDRAALANLSQAETLQLIQEAEPQRPSQRVGSSDSVRAAGFAGAGMAPAALARRLCGDLDWIVITALEKDRARRYATVGDFAADVGRHLADEPIHAHPPSAGYRLRKFSLRHKVAIGAAGLGLLALVGVSVGLVWSLRAEARARTDARIAAEINRFLNDDLLAAVAPEELGADVRVRDVLDAASRKIEGRFSDQPEVEASIRLTLGRTYRRLAEFQQAERHLHRALDLRVSQFGTSDARTLDVAHELGLLTYLIEKYPEAEAQVRAAYEGRARALGADHPDTLDSAYWLAVTIGEQGRYAEAEPMFIDTLDRCRRTLGRSHQQSLVALRGLAVLYSSMGDPEKARPLYEEAYRLTREALGLNNSATLLAMKDLANMLIDHEPLRARDLLVEALQASQTVRGERHPSTLLTMGSLGRLNASLGEVTAAEQMLTHARDLARDTMPKGHTVVTRLEIWLAQFYDSQDRFDESEQLLLYAITSLRAHSGQTHPLTQQTISTIVEHYRRRGRPDEADAWEAGQR